MRTFKFMHKKSKVITPDIKKLMQQRDDAHKLASQTSNPREWKAYTVLRRKVKSAIKSSETQLIRDEISKSRDIRPQSGRQSETALSLEDVLYCLIHEILPRSPTNSISFSYLLVKMLL